jgi:prolyl-tRNA editing enzyme YbaK/EbsC (Cys-tRNA(Pro) deacylase)
MLTVEELQTYLEQNDCDFEIIAHEAPILSAQDAANYFDVDKAAPTLILQTEQGLVAFVTSSLRGRVDFISLKQTLGFAKMKMADRSTVLETTGYQAGAVPLIGHQLPCIFDNLLLSFDYVFGGTGDEYRTLKIAPSDVRRLNKIVHFVD